MKPVNGLEILTSRLTVDIPAAAPLIGISQSNAYKLAQRGEFPCRVLKIGGRYVVPTAGLRELLGVDATATDAKVVA